MAKKLIEFHFDDKAEAAAAEALRMAAESVTEISKGTEKTIRKLIARAITEGIPPFEAAKLIQPLIGLDLVQTGALESFEERIKDKGLAPDAVARQVEQYKTRLLKQRSVKISRTKILDALNAGQEQSWRQAQAQGLLTKDARKEVVLTPGACPICVGVASQGTKLIGESFALRGPPFHPHCRCTIAVAIPVP